MENVLKLYEELKNDYDNTKEHPEKFIQTLAFAEEDNKKILKEYSIKLKPSQWIVLTIEPEILEKTILRGRDLGFLDAYIQNPAFLKQDVDAVIKRISELDSLSIPYKNSNGKYQSFLFSQRGFNFVKSQNGVKKESTPSINDIELKEYADRVMETFALTSEKQNVYAKLVEVENEGLGLKESLMKVFNGYSDNHDYLSECIDEILMNNEEVKGRVA